MDGQPEGDARHAAGADGPAGVLLAVVEFPCLAAEVMLMKLKHAQKGDHHDDADHRPQHPFLGAFRPRDALQAMGQEVIHGNSHDETGNQAQHELGTGVGQGAQRGEPSSQQRGAENRQAIPQQQQHQDRFHAGWGSAVRATG